MNDERRYQVFVSSTYEDLQEARQKVIQSLLELNCIPCGMEWFPAANEEVWDSIKELIAECDYYVVVVAGRYGSQDADGISYTEKEYRFALEKGIPAIAFLHADIGKLPSSDVDQGARLKALLKFRELCGKRLCGLWENPDDLRAKVTTSLVTLQKRHPAIGWIRANAVANESAKEILRLRDEVDALKMELSEHGTLAGIEDLAKGDEVFQIPCIVTDHQTSNKVPTPVSLSWNTIFDSMGIGLLEGLSRDKIDAFVFDLVRRNISSTGPKNIHYPSSTPMQIIIQLRALGLIVQASNGDWRLSPRGEALLWKSKALKSTAKPAT
jgi:hypothetical protein